MNKVTKFLFIFACILLVIYLFMKGYVKKSNSLSELIGNKVGGGELSVTDYYSLAQCVQLYKNYLVDKDYDNAYKMLNNNYKDYVSFDDYKELVSKKDYEKMTIKDINIITATTFKVVADISGEIENFTIVLGDNEQKSFLLLPGNFLDYKKMDSTIKKNKVECELKSYVVSIDKSEFNLMLKNNSSDDLRLTNATLITKLGDKIETNLYTSISEKNEKEFWLSFETEYAFPRKLILSCENGTELTFEFKD